MNQEPIKKNLRYIFETELLKPAFEKWMKACFDAKVNNLEDVYILEFNGIKFEAELKFKEKK